MRRILFYRVGDEYGEFSNFAAYAIDIDGVSWPTTEHYFQAQKFAGTASEERVRRTSTSMSAAELGRSLPGLRSDWEDVKDEVMLDALWAKFTQHPRLRKLLLGTGDAEIIEHTVNDDYWGDGGDGSGRNRLGALLMEVREELAMREPI